jgi:hypothetical protein
MVIIEIVSCMKDAQTAEYQPRKISPWGLQTPKEAWCAVECLSSNPVNGQEEIEVDDLQNGLRNAKLYMRAVRSCEAGYRERRVIYASLELLSRYGFLALQCELDSAGSSLYGNLLQLRSSEIEPCILLVV